MADSLLGRAALLIDDCIVAVSTPPGRGAVGIVRISGNPEQVREVLAQVLRRNVGPLQERHLILATVHDTDGEPLDRSLCAWFAGPRSYTGEDVVELHMHGNPVLLEQALRACVAAGARLAGPGEFTRRAVARGKLSLLEAEAVDALIRAPGAAAARVARQQLGGELGRRLESWRARLVSAAVALEALVDFPEEVDESDLLGDLRTLSDLRNEMDTLLNGARAARRLLHGVRVAIIGPVNAGKSTLLNGLLGHERAIVSPIPGTTRDVVSETVDWGGITFRLEDTAGLRRTDDPVEAVGIERSTRSRDLADLVVSVRDGRQSGGAPEGSLWVATHADLLDEATLHALRAEGWLVIDGRSPRDVEQVREALVMAADPGGSTGDVVLHTTRQESAMRNAREALEDALGVELEEPVVTAVALRRAGRALEELGGTWVDEQILDELFARFCIGK